MARRRIAGEAAAFAALAFALAWGWAGYLIAAGAEVRAGALPTHFPALAAPLAAALILAARAGTLRAFVARLVRGPRGWQAWALAATPLPALALVWAFGDPAGLRLYSGLPVLPVLPWLALILVVNGLGEEAGWRGYLLPRLQALWGARAGTLATGAVWAVWHAPFFALVATYRAMDPAMILFGFGIGILAGACVLAHLAALARGGVVLAVLWHTGFNLATATQAGGPAGPVLTALAILWALWLLRNPAAMAVPGPDATARLPESGAGRH